MNITADTNVLVRIVMQDDAEQATIAQALFLQATVIAIPVPVFCEFAWVLKRGYASSVNDIVSAIEATVRVDAVVTDLPAVEAGLTALAGGRGFCRWCPRLSRRNAWRDRVREFRSQRSRSFCETRERKRPTQRN